MLDLPRGHVLRPLRGNGRVHALPSELLLGFVWMGRYALGRGFVLSVSRHCYVLVTMRSLLNTDPISSPRSMCALPVRKQQQLDRQRQLLVVLAGRLRMLVCLSRVQEMCAGTAMFVQANAALLLF